MSSLGLLSFLPCSPLYPSHTDTASHLVTQICVQCWSWKLELPRASQSVTACWGQKYSRETTENDGDMVDWRDPPPSNQLQLAVLYLYDFFSEIAAVINYGANATYKQINKK